MEIKISENAFAFRKAYVLMSVIVASLFVVFGLFYLFSNDINTSDITVLSGVAGVLALICFAVYQMTVDCVGVVLKNDTVEISDEKKMITVPLMNIENIDRYPDFNGAIVKNADFYALSFIKKTEFGRSVVFYARSANIFGKEVQNNVGLLKKELLKQRNKSDL